MGRWFGPKELFFLVNRIVTISIRDNLVRAISLKPGEVILESHVT